MTAVAQQVSTKVTTVASRVRDRGRDMPDQIALREKDFGIWQEVTWADYWDNAQDFAHGLLALGVQPGERIAVQSENAFVSTVAHNSGLLYGPRPHFDSPSSLVPSTSMARR